MMKINFFSIKYSLFLAILFSTSLQAAEDLSSQVKQQSLLDIYHQAMAHDPTLASALSANKAAQEIIEQGKALYRPTVNFNADASTSRTDIRYLNGAVPPGNSSF